MEGKQDMLGRGGMDVVGWEKEMGGEGGSPGGAEGKWGEELGRALLVAGRGWGERSCWQWMLEERKVRWG